MKAIRIILIGLVLLILTNCVPPEVQESARSDVLLRIRSMGRDAINYEMQSSFGSYEDKHKGKTVYIALVDDLPLGRTHYSEFSDAEWALEEGIGEGLLRLGYNVSEKLDSIFIRPTEEYIGTDPSEAFYLHAIDLKAREQLVSKYKADLMLTYQISDLVDTSVDSLSALLYFRLIDLKNMHILISEQVLIGNNTQNTSTRGLASGQNVIQAVSTKDIPQEVFEGLSAAAILNIEPMLNQSKIWNKPTMDIENALHSAIIKKVPKYSDNPFLLEKTGSFQLKYAQQYSNIVFNTNPLIYESWDEVHDKTKVNEIIMYRIYPGGLYLKIIDVQDNGRIIYSDNIAVSQAGATGPMKVFNSVSNIMSSQLNDFSEDLKGQNIMIINGGYKNHYYSAMSAEDIIAKEHNYLIEEAMIKSLLLQDDSSIKVYDKLNTVYLKQPWMYSQKVFNLNSLYLDNWDQLRNNGIDRLFIYVNLIDYGETKQSGIKDIMSNYNSLGFGGKSQKESDNSKDAIAIMFKIIDITSGRVTFSGQMKSQD